LRCCRWSLYARSTLTTNQYNITINNTDVGSIANISQVNITIPSTFTIIPGSNGSNADAELFENTSTILSWTNSTVYMINGTIVDGGEWKYFWFNASATTPGTYNITILAVNATGSNEQNISVEINDTTAPFNVSFNNNAATNNSNLSQNFIAINVTVNDTDGTFAGTLGNISYSIYYSNGTLINNTLESVSATLVNFTGLAEGTYHVNVTANDTAGNLNTTGEDTRVILLDTTAPFNVSFDGDTPANNTNLSQNFIAVNITVDDTDGAFAGTLGDISYSIYYSNGTLINNTLDSTNSVLINFTDLNDGTYHVNVTANDTAGNLNATGEGTRVILLDTTNPTASFSCIPTTPLVGERMVCSCSGSDAGSGVMAVSFASRPITLSGQNTEACTVTDYAGNTANATVTYTSLHAASSTSTGSTANAFWERTVVATSSQFVNGHTRELEEKHRLRFKIGAATHYLGVVELTATTAKINVSSTPQQATLTIGEEKKFSATNDSLYDVLVKLNSIANNKANITITSIYEETTPEAAAAQTPADNNTATDSGTDADAEEDAEESGFSTWGMIIGIVIAIIIIFSGYKIIKRKSQ